MRVVFFGSERFGSLCLKEFLKEDEVVAIFTTEGDSVVSEIASANGIDLYPDSESNDTELVGSLKPDIIFMMGWRKIVAKEILETPKLGCFGIHCALLPKYRGCAPFSWPIITGATETGASLFKLVEDVDAGPLVAQKKCKIGVDENVGELQDKLHNLSLDMLRESLPKFRSGKFKLTPQKGTPSYYGKRSEEDGLIDWNRYSITVYNLVRGLAPLYPAFSFYKGQKVKILKVTTIGGYHGVPGSVITRKDGKPIVATGNCAVIIEEVDIAKYSWLNLKNIKSGGRFESQ